MGHIDVLPIRTDSRLPSTFTLQDNALQSTLQFSPESRSSLQGLVAQPKSALPAGFLQALHSSLLGRKSCLRSLNSSLVLLTSLAEQSSHIREQLLDGHVVRTVLRVADPAKIQQTKVWQSLSAFLLALYQRSAARPDTPITSLEHVRPALPSLALLLHSKDELVLRNAVRVVGCVLQGGCVDRIQAVLSSRMCQRLVDLLGHPCKRLQCLAARAVGRLVTGTDEQTDVVMRCNLMSHLPRLLALTACCEARRDAAWLACNVSTDRRHIGSLLVNGVVSCLVALVADAQQPLSLREYALRALRNATTGDLYQLQALAHTGCIEALGSIVRSQQVYTVRPALVELACGGLRRFHVAGEVVRAARRPGLSDGEPATAGNPFAGRIARAMGVSRRMLPLALQQQEWSPQAHREFPTGFKAAVRELVMAAHTGRCQEPAPGRRRQAAGVWSLSVDQLTLILRAAAYPLSCWIDEAEAKQADDLCPATAN